MPEQVINLHNVSKTFGSEKALKSVDFDLFQGEVHCLIGQNGCGKSTLIKIMAGVLKQDSGEPVKINGVSVIYQDLSLFPNLTIAENIYFPLYRREKGSIRKKEWIKKAEEVLQRLHVNLDLKEKVENLSVADRQLVAIARALIINSRILIMDEPTSSLTPQEVCILFDIIRSLKKDGVSMIFVSHRLDEIIEIADRITIMRDGAMIKTVPKTEIKVSELSYLISGETISLKRRSRETNFEPLLKVSHLTKTGQFEDISFSLGKGEVLGISGKLGSGRTELALNLFGMNLKNSGTVYLENRQVDFSGNKEAIRSGIAYVPEDRILQGIAIDQPVAGNLTAVVLHKFRNKIGILSKSKMHNCVKTWMEILNIKNGTPHMKGVALSGGNQQKVVLAKWLETNPKVLILDQPTNGIDIGAKSAIYELIRELSDAGMGIIIISDELQELYYTCDKIMIMEGGKSMGQLALSHISLEECKERVKNENRENQ